MKSVKNRLALIIAPFIFATVVAAPFDAAAIDVTGEWIGSSLTGGNSYANYFVLYQQGNNIYGTQLAGNNATCSFNGVATGNQIQFHSECPTINYSSDSVATVAADSNSMSGTFIDSQATTGTFTATKQSVPTLDPSTTITQAPVIKTQKQNVTFILKKFLKVSATRSSSGAVLRKVLAKSPALAVRYTITIKGAERRKLVSAKNKVTAKNLKPGTYTATYRVSAVRKNTEKKVYTTNTSPVAGFTVRK